MDALKKFMSKKKIDVKFKTAGPGHKLTGDESEPKGKSSPGTSSGAAQVKKGPIPPSEEKRQAAAAALARLEKQRKPDVNDKERLAARQMAFIKEQARREIEEELRMKESSQPIAIEQIDRNKVDSSYDTKPADPANYAVDGVFFTCPLIGPEVSTKDVIEDKIKEFLLEQPEEELAITSCLLICSCNKPQEKITTCVDILCKYLDNIIGNPDNPKVKKIRFANKAYQEKIAVVEGSVQFLQSAGFKHTRVQNDDTGEEEEVWWFNPAPDSLELSISQMIELRDTLKQTTPIKPEIDRNLQVLMPAEVKQRKELPPEFYQLTVEEIKREQQSKTDLLERELTLRTKAQRERDELREQRVYRYCVMRIRFPDGFTLQGTFWAHEKLSDVYEFVRQNLVVDDLQFALKMPRGETLLSSDANLSDNKLPPASIVNLHVENPPAGLTSGEISYLKPDLLALVKPME